MNPAGTRIINNLGVQMLAQLVRAEELQDALAASREEATMLRQMVEDRDGKIEAFIAKIKSDGARRAAELHFLSDEEPRVEP